MSQTPIIESLEPRILLSADLPGFDVPDLQPHDPTDVDVGQVLAQAHKTFQAAATERARDVDDDDPVEDPGLPAAAGTGTPVRQELIIVDPGVPGYDTLLADVQATGSDGVNLTVFMLDPERDGILQISELLSQYSGLDAVHLITHGSPGSIQLGSDVLDLDTLQRQEHALIGWSAALSDTADMLIYGCDLAANVEGRLLVDMLAGLTGADVAASDDLTGHASLGGDWDLEYQAGETETAVLVPDGDESAWLHTLGIAIDGSASVGSDTGDLQVAHTTSGSDRLMLVGVTLNYVGGGEEVTGISYNADALYRVGFIDRGDVRTEIWALVAPDIGTYNVDVTFNSSSDGVSVGVMTFTGVDQSTPLGSFQSNTGSSAPPASITMMSAVGELAFGVIAVDDPTDYDLTADAAGQAENWDGYGGEVSSGGSTVAGAASLDMSWGGFVNDAWAIGAVSIKPSGAAASITTSFQDGDVNGYGGTVDTFLNAGAVTADNSSNSDLQVDMDDGVSDPTTQALIRFDNLFGTGPGQIPIDAYITSASLTVNVNNTSEVGAVIGLHPMLTAWSDTDTWNSMSAGISLDGIEAAVDADSILSDPTASPSVTFSGLETRLQAWLSGTSANNGWVVNSNSTNGWDFDSSEGTTKPLLSVTYVAPGTQASVAHSLTVDTTSDVLDGDATSIDALLSNKGTDGKISLREAILAANNTTNIDGSTPDQIGFNIGTGDSGYTDPTPGAPGSGDEYWTIAVDAAGLPYLLDPVILDATTQPGYSDNPVIELDGSATPTASGINGIALRTNDSTVKGFVVHSFGDEGIEMDGSTGFGDNNTIQNNWVGIDAEQNIARNAEHNILVAADASGNLIGGTGLNEGNVTVYTNAGFDGINIRSNSNDNIVEGNFVGVLADGVTAAGNGRDGVRVELSSDGNRIGGTAPGAGNVIAQNGGNGIDIQGVTNGTYTTYVTGTTIVGNTLYANTGSGIDLNGDGVTSNDAGDGDPGPNELLNYPLISSAALTNTTLRLSGSLDTDVPTTDFRIEFFANTSGTGDPTNGEARVSLGSAVVTTDGSGDASFNDVTFTGVTLVNGDVVTATATQITDLAQVGVDDSLAFGSTSEYAVNEAIVAGVNYAPVARPDGVHLAFDGGDFVQVADDPSLQMGNNMTMEAWVNHSGLGSGSEIILNKEGEYELGVAADTGEIIFAFARSDNTWSWRYTGAYLTAGEWSHIAVTYDGIAGEARAYVDGVLVDTFAQSGTIGDVYTGFNDLYLGGRENAVTQRFQGQIDEVRIWDTTRSQGEIQSTMNGPLSGSEPGLVGNWRFDEAFGGQAIDQSASLNHGVLGGSEGAAATPTYQGYFTSEDAVLNVPAGTGLLANDSDPDADTLSITNVDTTGMLGALIVNSVDGSFSYDPRGALDSLAPGERSTETFTYTANDGSADSAPVTVSITVIGANDAPTAANNTITTNEDTAHTFSAGDFSFADIDGDTLASIQVTSLETAGALQLNGIDVTLNQVITKADIDAGNLTFDPAINANGIGYDSFGFSVNDGTTDSAASYTLTVDVTPVNDAPTAANNTITTSEDTAHTFAATDFSFADIDGDTLASIQVTSLETAGALQLNGVDVTLNQVITKADIDAGNLTFAPATNANGVGYDSFGFSVNDGTTDSAASYTLTVDVTPVNDAPTAANNTITTNEDTAYTFSAADFSFADIDGDTLASIQVTSLETAGALQLNGVDVTLNQVITKADIDAGNLTFSPATNANGIGYDSFGFSVNDGTTDSAASYTLTVDVTPVNDAPTVNATSSDTGTEDTDQVYTHAEMLTLIGAGDVDDANSALTVAVTNVSNGSIALSGGTGGVGTTFTFTPTANFVGNLTFDYQVSDDESPTPASSASGTATVALSAVNDAPVLDNSGTMTLPTITKSQTNNGGIDVASIIDSASGDRITDVDSGAFEGIAITTLASGNGTWEYLLSGGGSWTAIGSVSNASALLLGANDLVRFVPNSESGTTASFDFQAWDQTTGAAGTKVDASTGGGTTAFSTATETANITVADVNVAPVLDDAQSPVLSPVDEDAGAPVGAVGSLVSELVDFATPSGQVDNVTDVDSGAGLGIAVTAADTTNGTWFYSTDNGATWSALGAVSESNARLLAADASTRLYFQADADYHGTLTNAITFHAWDQTSGINGGTADLNASGTQTLLDNFSTMSYSNNNGSAAWSGDWIEVGDDGDPSASGIRIANAALKISGSIYASIYREADLSGAATPTLSFNYNNTISGGGASQVVLFQVSGDGGSSYSTLYTFDKNTNTGAGSKTVDISAFAAADTRVRIINTATGGTSMQFDDIQIEYGVSGGGSSAFSAASDTASLIVDPVADTPSITGATTNEDTQSSSGLVITRNAVDGAEVSHYKITGIMNGTLYQNDGVTQITNGSFITIAEGTAGLKFTPTADFNGTGTFNAQASTSNSDAGLGGSTAVANVTVTPVNDAPTAANNTVTTNEDTAYTFSAGDFSFADIDGDTLASIQVTSLETAGALQLNGIDVTLNQVITKADIDAGNLTFDPATNANGIGYDSFGFSVNDGTTDSAASYTLTVDVTPVNDAPTAANNTVTTNEDTAYTFSAGDFSFADIDGDTLASIQVTSLETAGALQLNGIDVTLNQVITKADIDAGNLTFDPATNANGIGYDSFGFSVNDGTTDSAASYTLTVDVTPVNDAPTAANNTITTNEDTAYTFSAADFSFSDIDGDTLASIQVTSLETAGALQLNGIDVTLNQVITKADIDAGNLTFAPATNANGIGYDSFGFSVNDGTVDSASSYTLTVDVTPVNDAPTAANNTVTTNEDAAYTFAATDFSFADIDGDTLASIQVTSLETAGALQLNGIDVTLNQVITKADIDAGNLTFDPAANANGIGYDSFGFSVNDGTTDSAASYTLTVDVTPVNDAPTAANNTVTTNEDTAHTFSAGDFSFADIDGDTLASIQVTSLETAGALQLNGIDVTLNQVITKADIDAGNLTFAPATNANGVGYDSFGFSVNDGTTDSAASYTLTVDVTPVNDAPTAANNTITTNEDTAHTFSAGDFSFADIDGDTLASIQVTSLETAGALQLNGIDVTLNQVITKADIDAGNLTFDPAANANGIGYDSFGFSVNDGTTDSAASYTLTVDVTPVNDAPTAANNTVTTNEDTAYTFSAGDFSFADIDGDTLASIQVTSLETAGALQLNGIDVTLNQVITKADIDAGNLTFDPAANANGIGYDSFGFSVNDGTTDSAASYTLTVDVTPVNDAPTAANNTVTTNEDTAHTFSAGDFSFADIDGDTLASIQVTSLETAGALQLNGIDVTLNQVITKADIDAGNLTFDPAANANGIGYDSFGFSVNDGTVDSASSYTLTVDVTPVNDAPTAANNTVTTNEDAAYTFAATDFSFADIDGDTLASIQITTLEAAGALQLNGIDVTLNQVITKADIDAGNLTFAPATNANGVGYDSFGFSVNDGTVDSASSYTLTVDVTPVNDAPTAANNTVTTNEDAAYTFAATDFSFADIDGDTLASIQITTLEAAGALQLNGIDVTLNQVITKADIDAGNLTFAPATNANGAGYDSFGFSVNDGTVDSASSYTLTVDVTPVNDAPTAVNNTVTTNEDAAYTFAATDFSFADIDGDTLASIQVTSLETAGALQLNGVDVTLNQVITKADIDAGNLTFAPATNANGIGYDSFGFSVNDGTVDSASSYTLTVDVTPVNDAPTAANNTVTTNEDAAYTFAATDFSFADIDGDTLASIQVTSLETAGALQLNGIDVTLNQVITKADIDAGNLTFDPAANANGIGYDSFGFSVNDGTVDSASSYTLTVDATPVNDAPTAANNTITTNEDTAYTFSAADFSFSDIDGDTLASIQITTLEAAGALQLNGIDVTLNQVITKADIDAGNLTFDPAANANGIGYDSFGFSVNDGTVDSASSYTLTVDVTPVNDAPTAANNTITTSEDTAHTFAATDFSFADIDGDTLASIQITTLEAAGALQLNGIDVTLNQVITKADIDAGNLTFSPATNANGIGYDSFGFSVNDGTTDSAASYTLNVDVTPVNDAPTTAPVTLAAMAEDSGARTITQVELLTNAGDTEGDGLTATALAISGGNGTLVDNGNGTWDYTPDANDDSAVSFTYTISDGVDTVAGSATLDITPVNDTPVVSGSSTGSVTEDQDPDMDSLLEVGGVLTATDPDAGESGFIAATTAGSHGQLAIDAMGNWTYSADNTQPAIQQLDAGQNATDVIAVHTTDGTLHNISITINGAEDAAVVSGTTSGAVTEDGTLVASGALSISDIDTADNPVSFPDEAPMPGDNAYGVFELSAGNWTYTLDNANSAVQALTPGASLNDSHTFTASDGTTQVVTIVIAGAAEPILPPVIEPPEPPPVDPPTGPDPVDPPAEPEPEPEPEEPGDKEPEDEPEDEETPFNPAPPGILQPLQPDEILLSVLAGNRVADAREPTVAGATEKPGPAAAQTFLQELRSIWQSEDAAPLAELTDIRSNQAFMRDLGKMSDDMNRAIESEGSRMQLNAEAAAGVSISLTAGFVSWALRAGSMMASLLAAMPTWRHFDPMPILGADDESRDKPGTASDDDDPDAIKQEDDSVNGMFDR